MTHDAVRIRPARPDDASAIRRVCVDGWRRAYAGLLPDAYIESNLEAFYTTARLQTEIEEPGAAGRWLVAVAAAKSSSSSVEPARSSVVGAGRGTPPSAGDCEVFTLYVHPDAQGCGIGTSLLSRITDRQREAGGCEQAVSVFAGHEPAIDFYKRHGFERIETRPSDIVAGVDPAHRTVRFARRI